MRLGGGRNGVLSSHLPWGDPRRGWDFVSAGRGDVPWEDCFRALRRSATTARSRSSGRTPAWTACTAPRRPWSSCGASTTRRPRRRSTRRSRSSHTGPVTLDLNADLGEEITDDAGLLAVVTSANVACGYHAGTTAIMREVCAEAARRGVSVGAQVSYDDRPNFGRVALRRAGGRAARAGGRPGRHADRDRGRRGRRACATSSRTVRSTTGSPTTSTRPRPFSPGRATCRCSGCPVAAILTLATSHGREVWHEGFPDRGYTDEGRLVPRDRPGAVLEEEGRGRRRRPRARDPGRLAVRARRPPRSSGPRPRRTPCARGRGVPARRPADHPQARAKSVDESGCICGERSLWTTCGGHAGGPKFGRKVAKPLVRRGFWDIELSLPTPLAGLGIGQERRSIRRLRSSREPGDGGAGPERPDRSIGCHPAGRTRGS